MSKKDGGEQSSDNVIKRQRGSTDGTQRRRSADNGAVRPYSHHPSPNTLSDQSDQGAADTKKTPADLPALRRRAGELFDRMQFKGDRTSRDSRLVWQVGQLVERGKLAEGVAIDAAGGPPNRADGYPDRPIGFFRTCLAKAIEAGGGNLNNMLKGARLPKGYVLEPEHNGADLDAMIEQAAESTRVEELKDSING